MWQTNYTNKSDCFISLMDDFVAILIRNLAIRHKLVPHEPELNLHKNDTSNVDIAFYNVMPLARECIFLTK